MRPYIIACYEVLRRRRIQPPACESEAAALVTALDLRDEATRLAAEIFATKPPAWLASVPACPECAHPLRDALEALGQQYLPRLYRPTSICNHPAK